MADHAGALTILALALLLVWALHALQRRLASGSADDGEAAAGGAAPGTAPAPPLADDGAADDTADARSGAGTRIHVPFLVRALLFALALAGAALLVPWALSVGELGARSLLGLALVAGPSALGLLHARARGRIEW